MVFWCAMGVERSLAQYRICRSHPIMFFSNIVLGCMRCLWAGRDSHLSAGADLDCFGIAYGHFGGVRLLQIRALISAHRWRRLHVALAVSGAPPWRACADRRRCRLMAQVGPPTMSAFTPLSGP